MTRIINQLLEEVAEKTTRTKIVDIVVGSHWTLVVLKDNSSLRAGLASALAEQSDHHHGGSEPVKDAGHLLEYETVDLLNLALSSSMTEVSIGFATLNALLDVDLRLCREVNALDIIMERGAGHDVAVVGHFPFTPKLNQVAKTLWVLERNPQGNDLPASEAPHILPQADVVAITGTSLANGTFDDLLVHCKPGSYVVVLGATTPLSPLLLDAGIHAIAGTLVVDPDTVKLAVRQGATFRQIKGKRLLTMANW